MEMGGEDTPQQRQRSFVDAISELTAAKKAERKEKEERRWAGKTFFLVLVHSLVN